jgi:O-antigen/teichoic acid export membrane protein
MDNIESKIPQSEPISSKIIRNTIFNAIGRCWAIIIVLILTPYIIHHIGEKRYGIWVIVGVITGYFGLFDFGVETSFEKYISEYYTKKDFKCLNEVVNTGFVFYSLLGATTSILVFILIKPIIGFLNIPNNLYTEAFFVFMLGIIIFALTNALSIFRAIQGGLQRMDISNKITIAISLPNIAGTIYFLESGYGLQGLMINYAIVVLVTSTVNIFFGRFANLISFQTDKILITHFLSLGMVIYYQLGASILLRLRQVLLLLISALVPAVSEAEARNEEVFLKELYLRGSKYLIFITIPALFFITTNASLVISAWMGEGYERSALVIQILAVGYFAATVTGVASSIAAGVARTDIDMKFGLLLAVLNLSLSIFLIIKFGFIGVVLGTTVSLIVASFIFIKLFHDYFSSIPLNSFFQLFNKPLIACIMPVLIMIFLNHSLQNISLSYGRLVNISILGMNGILFALSYIIFIILSKYFDKYDIEIFKVKIPFLKYLLHSYEN